MEPIFTNSSNGAAHGGERGQRTGRMGGVYKDGNGVTWEYEEIEAGATCSIWPKNRSSISGRVEIPGTVEGDGVSIKVVSIGKYAFSRCSGLMAVTIPEGVTQIGESTFEYCSKLTAVTIPSSVTRIGDWAFCGCSGLKEVTIPSSVTEIGERTFFGCSGLTAVTILSSVTRIGSQAFSDCSGLTEVTIPGSVTEIGESAFEDCKGLTAVTIPSSVTKIRDRTFRNCIGLTAVTIPSSVTAIGEYAFDGCSGLTTVTISGSVTKIGNWAFLGCSGLTAVTISGSVTEIGESAFEGCSGLTAVTIPDGVTKIGVLVFLGCIRLTAVTIPSSVAWIGDGAFFGCIGLTAVTIPSSVTAIGEQAFLSCSGLNAVYWLADANCSVGRGAFDGIASPAMLYVRQGEKAAIEGRWWAKKYFSAVVEGYVVTFQDGEGNKLGEQLVKPNGTATEPAAPIREGFVFVEWQLGGKRYDLSTPVTKDITLVAKWKKADNHGTAVKSVQLAEVRVVRDPMGEALELEGMERAAQVEVYRVVVTRVHAEALRGEPRVAIDARGWESGVYVVRVVASDGERKLRVVK